MPVPMPRNDFKARLHSGPCQIGIWSSFGTPVAAEILGAAGFDWIILDTEHGNVDVSTTMSQLQAVSASGTPVAVRIAANDPVLMKKALDIGAQTIVVPQVESAEEARRAIAGGFFPPRGVRGIATTARAARYGAVTEFFTRADAEICILLMIESRAALRALPEILAVAGVDAILFGPQDLAADMGFLAQPNAPEVVAAIEQGIALALSQGKAPGVAAGNEADATRWIGHGARFVTCGSDIGLLARNAEALAQRLVQKSPGA